MALWRSPVRSRYGPPRGPWSLKGQSHRLSFFHVYAESSHNDPPQGSADPFDPVVRRVAARIEPSVVTYTSLINRAPDFATGRALFDEMVDFKVVGICDIDQKRLDDAAPKIGNPEKSLDAAALAKKLKPDLFCFCTLPNLRTPMIRAALDSGTNAAGNKFCCGFDDGAVVNPIACGTSTADKRCIDAAMRALGESATAPEPRS